MNILFLTITHITSISERGIYTDLMRYFEALGLYKEKRIAQELKIWLTD